MPKLPLKYDSATGQESSGYITEDEVTFPATDELVKIGATGDADYLNSDWFEYSTEAGITPIKAATATDSQYFGIDDSGNKGFHDLPEGTDELVKVGSSGTADYLNDDWFERDETDHILPIGAGSATTSQYFGVGDDDSLGFHDLPEVGGELEYWTENRNTSAPNATVPAHQFLATGTETNIDAVVSPKGTGALLAQIPDGTTAGGDKRGSRAVDLQMYRASSSRVASGAHAVLGGGYSNSASGNYTTVSGGSSNSITGDYASISGGRSNITSGDYSFVSGAYNTCYGNDSAIVGGERNIIESNSHTGLIAGGSWNTIKQNKTRCSIINSSYSEVWDEAGIVLGGAYGRAASYNQIVFSAGRIASTGDAQATIMVFRRSISNSTGTTQWYELFLDGSSEKYVLSNYSAFNCMVQLTARQTNGSGILLNGLYSVGIRRENGVATTSVWSLITLDESQSGTNIYLTQITGDTSNGSVKIEIQVPDGYEGQAVAVVRAAETYAAS